MPKNLYSTTAVAGQEDWIWLQRVGASPVVSAPSKMYVTEELIQKKENYLSVFVKISRDHLNLPAVISCLLEELKALAMPFELIVVKDNFYMNSVEYLEAISQSQPVRVIERSAGRVTTSGLTLQDLAHASGDKIVIFDADLHYSVDAIKKMAEELREADVVFAKPSLSRMPWYRALEIVIAKILFLPLAPLFFHVPHVGLWAFRWEAIRKIAGAGRFGDKLSIVALFSFNRHLSLSKTHCTVQMNDDVFCGWTSQTLLKKAVLVSEIFVLRFHALCIVLFPFFYPPSTIEYSRAGFTNVTDYLFLSEQESAKLHFTKENSTLFFYVLILGCLVVKLLSEVTNSGFLTVCMGLSSVMYLGLLFLKLYVMYRARHSPLTKVTSEDIRSLQDTDLPTVTVLVPLYKERDILPQILKRLSEFDYPANKLDIIFILESNDLDTIDAFQNAGAPLQFRALLVPNVGPKTKPKALNVAITHSEGQIVVIYDAEILPDIDQLKKAVVTFMKNPDAKYLHARMNVYNADYNWLTKFYDGEFAFFYDYFLPGIVSMNVPLPISGHSTFFKREVLEQVGGWDPYNIAEDCDIGIRIYRHGFKSGMMLDSFSWEQSTATIPRWVRQRTRWVQGFIQTSLVHLRFPLLLKNDLGGWWNFLWFLILVPGNVVINVLNIVHWAIFFAWIMTQSPFIQMLYPLPSLYAGTLSFILGNYIFIYLQMLGLYARGHFKSVAHAVWAPMYWMLLNIATIRAILRYVCNPHIWDKTAHFSVPPNFSSLQEIPKK